MTVAGLGTYCSTSCSGQGKNHFSQPQDSKMPVPTRNSGHSGLSSQTYPVGTWLTQAHHCDFCQSETVRCEWRLWMGSGLRLAGIVGLTTIWVRD